MSDPVAALCLPEAIKWSMSFRRSRGFIAMSHTLELNSIKRRRLTKRSAVTYSRQARNGSVDSQKRDSAQAQDLRGVPLIRTSASRGPHKLRGVVASRNLDPRRNTDDGDVIGNVGEDKTIGRNDDVVAHRRRVCNFRTGTQEDIITNRPPVRHEDSRANHTVPPDLSSTDIDSLDVVQH